MQCSTFLVGSHASTVSQFFLQRGASVTMTAGGGDTVLHLAAAGAAADGTVVDLLLDSSADPEAVNDCNETPLLKACFMCPAGSKFPNQECAKQLVRRGARFEASSLRPVQPCALRCAAGTAGTDFVRFLLDHGADVNGSGDYLSSSADFEMTSLPECIRQSCIRGSVDRLYGATPLHWAAHFGNKEAAEVLVQNGADHNALNFMGHTAADVAKIENHTEVFKTLTAGPGVTRFHVATLGVCVTRSLLVTAARVICEVLWLVETRLTVLRNFFLRGREVFTDVAGLFSDSAQRFSVVGQHGTHGEVADHREV